jgi:outer membrane protein OmpA-like peptidoglycan-associated protein
MTRPKTEEGGEPLAPLWILSFGDMISNFLAFFILMQSFATSQRAELLQTGEGPVGVAPAPMSGTAHWLIGKRPEPQFGFRQRHYTMESDPNNDSRERIIDAEDEQLRKIFDDLRQQAGAKSSDGPAGRARLLTTPIRFAPGQTALDAQTLDFLATIGSELGRTGGGSEQTVCVIGLAPDVGGMKEQYIVSAMRAQAVRNALAGNLSAEVTGGGSRVLAWGIGAGPETSTPSAASQSPCIVVAVLESTLEE